MNPDDKTEMGIRFGCGSVLGLFIFGLSSIWFVCEDRGIYIAIVFFASFAFGLAALRFGDAFWRWFARWFWWFS